MTGNKPSTKRKKVAEDVPLQDVKYAHKSATGEHSAPSLPEDDVESDNVPLASARPDLKRKATTSQDADTTLGKIPSSTVTSRFIMANHTRDHCHQGLQPNDHAQMRTR